MNFSILIMKEILKYKQNQSLKKGHWKRTGYITTKNKKKEAYSVA